MALQSTLLRLALLINFFALILSEDKKCLTELSNGSAVFHCCDNKEDQNGTCVECSIGTFSLNGEPCQICKDGYFGRKCSDICHCMADLQICDNVHGCITRSTTEVKGDYSTVRHELQDSSTHIPNPEDRKGFFRRPEFVYVICSAILSTAIVACMVWFRHYTSKLRITGNVSANVKDDSYDTIDDGVDVELPNVRQISDTANDNASSPSIELPYEEVLPISEVHVYITEPIQSGSVQGENMDQPSTDHDIETIHSA